MILSGYDIKRLVKKQPMPDWAKHCEIEITPFDEKNLNPNSYNLTLDREILVYESGVLDPKVNAHQLTSILTPSSKGTILHPGRVYLANTVERTLTKGLVPIIDGRSSIGRLGLFIHVTAGYGDNGYEGVWTLELVPVQPIIVYTGMKLCQIRYQTISSPESADMYHGKYQNSVGATASRLGVEF